MGTSIESKLNIRIPDLNLECTTRPTRRQEKNSYQSQEFVVTAELMKPLTFGEPVKANYVELLIVNLRSYNGRAVEQSSKQWGGELRFSWQEWKFTVHSLSNSDDLIEALNIEGGYAVTHVGRLEREDNGVFSSDSIGRVLTMILKFLSFLSGRHVSTCFASARDSESNRLWEQWEISSQITPWRKLYTWLPSKVPNLDGLIDQFSRCHADEKWSEVLDTAVGWYIQSQNSDDAPTSILFAHLAIELLAWIEFVEINRVISESSFRKIEAAERIRLLLSHSQIPTNVPTTMVNIEKYRKSRGNEREIWDGPKVVAEYRNQFAHPNLRQKLKSFPVKAHEEVRQLAIWYVELCLLRLLKYDSYYFSRAQSVSAYEVKLPPWVKSAAHVEQK